MNSALKIPPKNIKDLTSPEQLAKALTVLIGKEFKLTKRTKTDGSNLRKLIGSTLLEMENLPEPANENDFIISPPKRKGVPKILREYIDTYIVTTGDSYNLQVWNRNPNTPSVQVEYKNGSKLLANKIRFILVKIDIKDGKSRISTIVIMSPDYIVKNFGKFGKPTYKSQLIISNSARSEVLRMKNGLLYYDDIKPLGNIKNLKNLKGFKFNDPPTPDSLIPISEIKKLFQNKILYKKITGGSTKIRGQGLERALLNALGYKVTSLLEGAYPDIRNQGLEVKIQDSPTVDLGKYSPVFDETIPNCGIFTTTGIRYLIALTNPKTNIVEGGVICPGEKLGLHFSYVGEKSYKCQRSIPMSFFKKFEGKSVFNPKV